MGKVVVVGSFMTDLMSRTPHLPKPGETVMGGPFKLGPGGKGSNQAVACSRLGGKVWFVGCLGNDYFGQIAMNNFKENGINTDFVRIVDGVHSGAALIMVSDETGENAIVVAPGANSYLSPDDVDKALDVIKEADVVLTQFEIPEETVNHLAEVLPETVTFLVNPAPGRKISDTVLKRADFLIPNESELEVITGKKVETVKDAENAAKILLDRGARNVIVTLGSKGALWVSKDDVKHFQAFEVKVVDTTGAGDAFCGAFALALSNGKNVEEAVIMANAAAAISVTRIGTAPSMPTMDEVKEFLSD